MGLAGGNRGIILTVGRRLNRLDSAFGSYPQGIENPNPPPTKLLRRVVPFPTHPLSVLSACLLSRLCRACVPGETSGMVELQQASDCC